MSSGVTTTGKQSLKEKIDKATLDARLYNIGVGKNMIRFASGDDSRTAPNLN